MAKITRKVSEKKPDNTISETRVKDPQTGKMIVLRTIKMNPETFGGAFTTVFQKNVDRARRENRALAGSVNAIK